MEKTLKKENGLRFLEPDLFIVLTNAIGRGVMLDERYWYNNSVSPDFKSIVFIIF